MRLLRSTALLLLPLAVTACGEDFDAATTDAWVSKKVAEAPPGASDPGMLLGEDASGSGVTPAAGADWPDATTTSPPDIAVAQDTYVAPPEKQPPDAGSKKPDLAGAYDIGWNPEWIADADDSVKGCLEMLPAICGKVAQCGQELPLVGALSGLCPVVFDALNPLLTQGCDQIGQLLGQALPDTQLPLVGSIGDIIPKLLKGCIENFNCDPQFIADLFQKLAGLGQLAGGLGGGGGGGGDLASALPALLELAQMCGGLGNLLGLPGGLPF